VGHRRSRRGGKGHQVFKFSPQGKVLRLSSGRHRWRARHLQRADRRDGAAYNGDIFVSDATAGETNARIVKFTRTASSSGRGKERRGAGRIQYPAFASPWTQRGGCSWADRANNRIQIFDQDGGFVAQWKQFGGERSLHRPQRHALFDRLDPTLAGRPGMRRLPCVLRAAMVMRRGSGFPRRPSDSESCRIEHAVAVDEGDRSAGRTASICATKRPSWSKIWMRLLARRPRYSRPAASKASECGILNSPGPAPFLSAVLMHWPSW